MTNDGTNIHNVDADFTGYDSDGRPIKGYLEVPIEWFKDKNFIHFICMLAPPRPGCLLFATILEYKFYPPNTPKNSEFIFHLIKWEEMMYAVISIPMKERSKAEAVCKKTGMRIADGIPTMFGGGDKPKLFPINGKNAFTIENEPDHPMYKSPAHKDAFLRKEHEMCSVIQQHGDRVVDDVIQKMKVD